MSLGTGRMYNLNLKRILNNLTKNNNQIKKEYHVGVTMLILARSALQVTLTFVMEIVSGVMKAAILKV